jgi:hypothetical protein
MVLSMAALSIAAPPIEATSIATTLGLGIVIYVVDAVTDRQEQAEDSRSGRFQQRIYEGFLLSFRPVQRWELPHYR